MVLGTSSDPSRHSTANAVGGRDRDKSLLGENAKEALNSNTIVATCNSLFIVFTSLVKGSIGICQLGFRCRHGACSNMDTLNHPVGFSLTLFLPSVIPLRIPHHAESRTKESQEGVRIPNRYEWLMNNTQPNIKCNNQSGGRSVYSLIAASADATFETKRMYTCKTANS